MELPASLRHALAAAWEARPGGDLADRVKKLQHSYRRREEGGGRPVVLDDDDAAAYAVYRFPATYGVLSAVMEEIKNALPDFTPASMLDLGAGPATAFFAAGEAFGQYPSALLAEPSSAMQRVGRGLAERVGEGLPALMQWRKGLPEPGETFDLVTASYVLGEMPERERLAAVDRLWGMTAGALALAEPAKSPAGAELLHRVRERLVNAGAHLAAPCPHAGPCPKTGDRWCHMGVRINRGRAHRMAKEGWRPYEDEKFSYLVFTRLQPSARYGVLTAPPQIKSGHVILEVCTAAGLKEVTVSKKHKGLYKAAKKFRWGQAVTPQDLPEEGRE